MIKELRFIYYGAESLTELKELSWKNVRIRLLTTIQIMISKQKNNNIRLRIVIILCVFGLVSFNKAYGQGGADLPVLEDFETDSVWIWKPWKNRGDVISSKTRGAAHSGKFGLDCKGDFVKRMDKQIGLPGQVISWWIRFQGKARAHCGFGIDASESGYYLCIDASTNTLHFARSADYTYPLLKVTNQTYQLNVWYRAEITFNTTTNVTGRLYSANGTTLLNSITLEIPHLSPGGIAFKGLALYADDIRGGTKQIQVIVDPAFAPKLGERLILKNIVFELNKSNLLEESFVELDRLVAYLKRNPDLNIHIVGHTDNIGKEEDNKNLSKARAIAVADYLIKHNVNKNKISCIGLGSSNPIGTNATEEGRKKNRRVECMISY